VLTSKTARGPSRDWVNIAKSSEARSKIRQWFKKERRDENIAHGRASFESELKHAGLTIAQISAPDMLPTVIKRLPFKSLDELYAAIGYGGFTSLKAVNRIRDLFSHQKTAAEKAAAEQAAGRQAEDKPPLKRTKSTNGIIVEGLDNCLVKFSKCCTPVPGDEIVGFITRGYGVSVHRRDCPNTNPDRYSEEDRDRFIKVSWADEIKDSYITSLEVVCKDRTGLIMDISTVFSTSKINVENMNMRSTADNFAIISVTFAITDATQLEQLMRRLHQISNVMDVKRPAG